MINTLKQFVGWDTVSSQNEFERATLTLTFYYVLSVLVILAISSFAILTLFSPTKLEIIFLEDSPKIELTHDDWSTYEFRKHLPSVVLVVDLSILFLASFFSYYLARNTLRPIKNNQEKQLQFMGDVAHELRTPLAVMLAGGETMLRSDRSPAEYKDYIKDVEEESERLTRLSNQLLQLLSINSVTAEVFKQCDLTALCLAELRKFQPYALEHNIDLVGQITESIIVTANQDDIVRLLQNLIKNAIDYTPAGGKVTVKAFSNEVEIVLSVIDTGVGVPLEMQSKIFDRFQTLDASRTEKTKNGVGLGLSIVKEIIHKHKGTIEFTSREGEGTAVVVHLPR